MRRPVIIAVLAILMVAALLVWRGLSPVEPVTLTNVTAQPLLQEPGVVHVGLTVETGDMPDVLVAVSSPAAAKAELVSPMDKTQIAMPARGTPALSQDGTYIRLVGVEGDLSEGRLIPITLQFLRSGEMTARARVTANADPHEMHMAMAAMNAVEDDSPAPKMSMSLEPAANGATLVRLQVENFTFAPETDPPKHVPGHGHAHLYLDGVKLGRMYSTEALIGALPAGTYDVRVDLNSNLHVPYMNDAGPVSDRAELVVE